MVENEGLQRLEINSTLAFQGKIKNGLLFHGDKTHIMYTAGHMVMLKDVLTGKETRCQGHSNTVSCIAVSKNGKYLASGQESFMGFKAEVIIWNFADNSIHSSYLIHNVKVEALDFACDSKYLVSLGGQDCGSVIVYDVEKKAAVCGSVAARQAGGYASILQSANTRNNMFITAGNNSLRVWKFNFSNKKIIPSNAALGKIKREIKCVDIDKSDENVYCGTSSGDILKLQITIEPGIDEDVYSAKLICCLMKQVKSNNPLEIGLFSSGVTSIVILKTNELLIGTGNGVVSRVAQIECSVKVPLKNTSKKVAPKKKTELKLKEINQTLVMNEVTSITLRGEGHQFYVSTKTSEIYRVTLMDFQCERQYTCHGTVINDIAFPHNCSDLFATCSSETVRIWDIASSKELLRIEVPNMTCNSVFIMHNGQSIITGWNDGKIRAYMPESGTPLYAIENAHQKGVTALCATSDCQKIVSGGGEGDIRAWDINTKVQVLVKTMKEHKGRITCIRMKGNDKECVTSCIDGSCIIWDLANFVRKQVVFANTLFQCVCYGAGECQIMTCGTDRKITYYEVLDGSLVRSLEGSLSGSINAIDITEDGKVFVTGGTDKLIKVWKYLEGIVTHVGEGHSDEITALRISPNKKYIVSVGKDGCIICWQFPA